MSFPRCDHFRDSKTIAERRNADIQHLGGVLVYSRALRSLSTYENHISHGAS